MEGGWGDDEGGIGRIQVRIVWNVYGCYILFTFI